MAWQPGDWSHPTDGTDTINYEDAELFLETLVGPEWQTAPLVFQTFDDSYDRRQEAAKIARLNGKRSHSDPFAKVHCGTWEKCKPLLTTINKNGGGVFVTVNQTEDGRKIENLKNIRAVWCEWDALTPPPEWPLAPHITVESSPGKFHFYWKAHDLTANDHYRVMRAMVGKWGSDPEATDVVRVLRVPGFFHRKIDSRKGLAGTPWRVRLAAVESADALPAYSLPELLRGFQVEQFEAEQQSKDSSAKQQSSGGRRTVTPINVIEVREALTFIPADDRQLWLKMGMALASTHHAGAFQLWDEWSRNSGKYDEDDQYRVWQSFREQKGEEGGITLGTLYKTAKGNGWDRDAGWSKGLLLSARGEPVACPANIALILRHTPMWSENLRFNTFTGRAEYGQPETDEFGRTRGAASWGDIDDMRLAGFLLHEYHMGVTSMGHCTQAIDEVAHDNTYDPITTWLESLPAWDEEPRLDHFFPDYCNAVPSPYTAFCGRSFFISLVARAYAPGCQVDSVIVLEGAEGARKTSLCRLLGGPWYKALSVSFENKDLFLALRRAWLAELAELDAFARAGQARIKSLLTTLEDSYRPAYARHEVDQPRRTVFIGTTNDPAYIVDPYGARRFFPIQVKDVQLDAVAAVLPQLFAEARDRYRAGEPCWTDDEGITAEATEIRAQVREDDPWEHAIGQYVKGHTGNILAVDIFSSLCLDVPAERRTRAQQTRIGIILKSLGYVKKRRRSPDDWKTIEYFYTREDENE